MYRVVALDSEKNVLGYSEPAERISGIGSTVGVILGICAGVGLGVFIGLFVMVWNRQGKNWPRKSVRVATYEQSRWI